MNENLSTPIPESVITDTRLALQCQDVITRLAHHTQTLIHLGKRVKQNPDVSRHIIDTTNEVCGHTIDLCTMMNQYVEQREHALLNEKWDIQS